MTKPKPVELTETQARIILALAQNGLKILPTAQALHYSRSNVDYQVARITETTGKDPRDFFDMRELLRVARKVLSEEGPTSKERALEWLRHQQKSKDIALFRARHTLNKTEQEKENIENAIEVIDYLIQVLEEKHD